MAEAAEDRPDPTLLNILQQTDLKWVFVGGKGGVGKTTCSCSLAVQLSAVRRNVLIISTDPAHNLSDAFRQKFTAQPTLVEGFTNLFAMEIDPKPEQLTIEGLEDAPASFLAELAGAIPGIDEAMSFGEVMRQVQTMDYSCIVFDTAPTGHTLRLLQFPTTLQKGLNKVLSLKGAMGGMVTQMSAMLGSGASDNVEDQLLGKLEQLKAVVDAVSTQFKDPELTTFICVCIPEFLSLYETERLVQELAKYEIDASNIVINQVIWPEAADESRLLAARIRMQQRYLEQFDELYEDFHIVRLPLLEDEVRGVDAIKEFSNYLMSPYVPEPQTAKKGGVGSETVAQLREEVERLRRRCRELEDQLSARK